VVADHKIRGRFVEPMPLEPTEKLPGGPWLYELKLDGFRAEAIKSGGRVYLRSHLQAERLTFRQSSEDRLRMAG
jgi:ATP-dependent DNA ligase